MIYPVVPWNLPPKHKGIMGGSYVPVGLRFHKEVEGRSEGWWDGREYWNKFSLLYLIRDEHVPPCPSGNIRNTEKLSYDKQRQYEILVTAYDCGQKPAAQDTLVQVDVKPVCKPGWQGESHSYRSCCVKATCPGPQRVPAVPTDLITLA